MPLVLCQCVECPKCHTRYLIGENPYRNGAYIISSPTGDADLRRLFCLCSDVTDYHAFKFSELKTYAVSHWAYERGYGSPYEIVLLHDEKKQAS